MEQFRLIDLQNPEASVSLNNGRYTIGGDQEDAIIFDGASKEHLNSAYADGYLTILSAKSTVWVDGKIIREFPYDVYPGDVVSLSEAIHFAIVGDSQEIPAIGALEAIAPKATRFALPSAQILSYGKWVGVAAAIGAAAVAMAIAVKLTAAPVVIEETVPEKMTQKTLTLEHLDAYVDTEFNKGLLLKGYDHQVLRLVVDATVDTTRAQEDLERVAKRVSPPIQIEVVRVDAHEVAKKISASIRAPRVKVSVDGVQITLAGVALPAATGEIASQVKVWQNQYPWAVIQNKVETVQGLDIKLVSTAVSSKTATATVKRGSAWQVVEEGGPVMGIGILKLIKSRSIVVATPDGDVEFSL